MPLEILWKYVQLKEYLGIHQETMMIKHLITSYYHKLKPEDFLEPNILDLPRTKTIQVTLTGECAHKAHHLQHEFALQHKKELLPVIITRLYPDIFANR